MCDSFTFGPRIAEHVVEFRLWAPLADSVRLRIEGRGEWEMLPRGDGWKAVEVPQVLPGELYRFILPDGRAVPDPASRFQPRDVHGPSELIDPVFDWQTSDWTGRPWEESVIYELHVGAFTHAGTFSGVIERLDYLKRLGVTAIQLMPVGDFPGRRGWGYDGVLPYAPDSSYGRPEDLKRLVDAAHARGLCVLLDVVYNHFGPDGNHLTAYAPIFSDHHKSAWGHGLNFDAEGSRFVREFVIQNALYWLGEFRMDGLRLDAVHAIKDDSNPHVLIELADRVRKAFPDRQIHLILENEDNNAALLARDAANRPRHFTAQWNDDIHHALHVAATGETFGYYGDYADYRPRLRRALTEGFAFQGETMAYSGRSRGMPSADLPPTAFVSFIQNHDQIGNRAKGDRMVAGHAMASMKAIAAIYLLSPQIPLLFMGEELGSATPFPFFCDFDEALNSTVKIGRREELKRLPGFDVDDAPDPTLEETFLRAKLPWCDDGSARQFQEFYRQLIAVRHRAIIPLIARAQGQSAVSDQEGPLIRVKWQFGGAILRLVANLSDAIVATALPCPEEMLFVSGRRSNDSIDAWSVIWSLTFAHQEAQAVSSER